MPRRPAFLATAALVAVAALGDARAAPQYVGSAECAACHAAEAALWTGSHHDLAMAPASAATVLGDFDDAELVAHGVTTRFSRRDDGYYVLTDGPDGALHEYPVRYTFGWYPLQQYLVPLPGGRLQAFGIAWDSRPAAQGGQRWFHLYPDEPMGPAHPQHWTGRDQTWNYQCAECHSTGLRKGYDLASDSYDTQWSEIDVACEACHGPGSEHLTWARAAQGSPPPEQVASKGLALDLGDGTAAWSSDPGSGRPRRIGAAPGTAQIQTCARCHSRRGQIWAGAQPGGPLLDSHRLALLEDHLYFPDGQIKDEVYVYGSFIQSRMHRAGVTCADCHDPHSLELRAEGNAVCTRCHLAERYDRAAHHHHPPASAGASCTACHMPERTYMVVDRRADHGLRVPRPDLAARLGTPDPCTECHADRTPRWAAAAIAGWAGGGNAPAPHFGEAFAAARRGAAGADERLLAVARDPGQPGIVRASAIARLRQPSLAPVRAVRSELLADADPLVRMAAMRSLDGVDLRTRFEQGWPALGDPVRAVRLEAARVLLPLLQEPLPPQLGPQLLTVLQEYLAATQVNADRAQAHLDMALVAQSLGRVEAAEAAYRTALRLEGDFAPAYVNFADLQRQLGREEAGERILRRGIAAAPADASLRHALGLALVRAGRVEEAIAPLRQAAGLDPQSTRFAYVLALALQRTGDLAAAIALLERLYDRSPFDRDVLRSLAQIHRASGDPGSADRYARELAALEARAARGAPAGR
jgi:tetratricopeptide (TPR) repeat protein